jgi:hypothetical protein
MLGMGIGLSVKMASSTENKRLLRGLCTRCGGSKGDSTTHWCKGCKEVAAIKKQILRLSRKAAKTCIQCGKRSATPLCPGCKRRQRITIKRYKTNLTRWGLCQQCRNPVNEFLHCFKCRLKRRGYGQQGELRNQ